MSRVVKSAKIELDDYVPVGTPQFLGDTLVPVPEEAVEQPALLPDPAVLLAEAQAQIEEMFGQAHAQIASWREQARQAGWQAGYDEGRQTAIAELSQTLVQVRIIAESAVEAHAKFLRDSQPEIGRLAIAIAEKILGRELTVNPSAITDIVAQVIEAAAVQDACRIHVNPHDYEILKPHWDAIASLQQPGRSWDLTADKNIERGGCVIETGGGTIDAQLSTQLRQIEQAFANLG